MRSEKGFMLIDVLVGIAIIGIVAAGYLGAMTTSYRAAMTSDQMDTARVLAQGQMEYIKKQDYASSYPIDVSNMFKTNSNEFKDYPGYTIDAVYSDKWRIIPTIPAQRDSYIQAITIVIRHNDTIVTTLQDCKTKR
jgi:type II secretory pathway pseudopilin PulG